MRSSNSRIATFVAIGTVFSAIACGGSDNATSPGTTGGAPGSAGSPGTGGTVNAAGTVGTGGLLSAGGSLNTSSVGGAGTGGSIAATGGGPVTGGSTSAGATTATGGTKAGTGGMTSAVGTAATGGTKATGGAAPTTGGATTTSPTTGGTKATGGAPATGGSAAAAGGGGNTNLQALVKSMAPGWNLGNSFDGTPLVTSYGNPAPNQTLINAVKAAGFNTMRIPVTWTAHIGAAPSYTIDAAWMAQVVQTAQWAVDAGLYAFVNTHHEADGNGGWVSFPATAAAASVATEVTAVWTQIATAFQGFSSKLMFECFNEPNEAGGGNTAQAQADLNLYLAACVNAIRNTGGANATRVVMIQPVGASPSQSGINAMLQASIISDPNLIVSIHTYYPTNFGLSTTPYAWGSSADYTNMANSVTQLRGWLPNWGVVIGEWGSEGAQATANRAAHALAYSQDTTTAGMCPIWWDNGGSGNGSYAIFNRTTGAETFPTIVNAIITGTEQGLATPNTYATLANP